MSMYTQIKFSRTDNGKLSRNYSFWNLSLILILNLKSFVNTGPDSKCMKRAKIGTTSVFQW